MKDWVKYTGDGAKGRPGLGSVLVVTTNERYLVKVRTNDWGGCVRNWVKGMRLVS